jgi:hypothetical protein
MDNPLFTSNSSLIIKRLRKRKLTTKKHLVLDRSKFNDNNFQKSFNFKGNNTTKNMLPSLSSTKAKYFTKSNSRASSAKDDNNNEKENKSLVKTTIYDKRKITLKIPEKIDNLKNVRNRIIKKGNNYFKTENNQKIIFNNIGINYHKTKFNNQKIKKSFDKKDVNSVKDMDRVNDNIKGLSIKNNKTKNGKNEKDNKIEILEEKIDKLINFIKNNETLNLKHKINTLQNDIEILKKENEKLKSELEAKNEIISSLENKQNQIIYQNNEIIDKMRSNKEKGQKIKNRNYDIDLDKLKLISIDPDDI